MLRHRSLDAGRGPQAIFAGRRVGTPKAIGACDPEDIYVRLHKPELRACVEAGRLP